MNRCTKVPFSNWFGLNCKVNSVVAYILMFRRHRSHNTSVIGSFFDWPESPFKWKNLDRIDKLRAYKELDHFVEETPIISPFEPVKCPVNLNWKKHFWCVEIYWFEIEKKMNPYTMLSYFLQKTSTPLVKTMLNTPWTWNFWFLGI